MGITPLGVYGVRASILRLLVVERTGLAGGVVLNASQCDMPELAAVVALRESVGGDDGGDASGVEEEANRGTHGVNILRSNPNGKRSSKFPLVVGWVRVKEMG